MIIVGRLNTFHFNDLHENIDEEGDIRDDSDDGEEVMTISPDYVVDDEQIKGVQQMLIK